MTGKAQSADQAIVHISHYLIGNHHLVDDKKKEYSMEIINLALANVIEMTIDRIDDCEIDKQGQRRHHQVSV